MQLVTEMFPTFGADGAERFADGGIERFNRRVREGEAIRFLGEDDGMVRRETGGFEFADLSGGFLLMRFGGNDIETGGLDE